MSYLYASSLISTLNATDISITYGVYNTRMAEMYLATAIYVWPAAVDTLPLVKTYSHFKGCIGLLTAGTHILPWNYGVKYQIQNNFMN